MESNGSICNIGHILYNSSVKVFMHLHALMAVCLGQLPFVGIGK